MFDIPLELPQPLKAVMGCWDFGKSLGWVIGWGFWEELGMGRWVGILGRAPGGLLDQDFGKSQMFAVIPLSFPLFL